MAQSDIGLRIDVASSAAPLLLGSLLNLCLYGVLLIQIYIFHISFPKDPKTSKAIVYTIFILESIQTILVGHDAYKYFATGFGDVDGLDRVQLQWLSVPVITGIVSVIVQIYYAWRISVFSDSRLLPIGVAVLSLLQASCALVEGVKEFQVKTFSKLAAETSIPCALWLAGGALCDIVIAISMALVLIRNDSGLPHTHHTITKLVHVIIGTGAFTALATAVDLILFLALPHHNYHVTVALCLAKLYSNSMMVVQNSRVKIIGARNRSPKTTCNFDMDATRIRFATHTVTATTTTSAEGMHDETWVRSEAVRMPDEETEEASYEESVKKSYDLTSDI